jgi:anti-anti-sigma factor
MAVPSKLRIGCLHRIRHFPYWATLAQGNHARARELGLELCLSIDDADEDWVGPAQDVMRQHPHVMILPYSVVEAFPEVTQPFQSAGIPLIGVETQPGGPYAGVVRADEYGGAEAVITYLFDRLEGRGMVVNIGGGGRTPRQIAFESILTRYPGMTLAYEGQGDWARESGRRIMRAALDRHPDVRGVFAHNDHMALGACDVVAERGLQDRICVVGFDADPQGLIAVRDGQLAATVYRGLYGVGRTAIDIAFGLLQHEKPAAEIRIPTIVITAENLVDATLDTTLMLPELLHDFVASSREQQRLQQEQINAQRRLIQELSTPIMPINDSILVLPLIGTLDTARGRQITEAMLAAITRYRASYLIIDITGISMVDTTVAHHLIQGAQAVQLLGARVMLVGISPEVAQTLVGLGIDFAGIPTYRTLQVGIEYAQKRLESAGRFRQ